MSIALALLKLRESIITGVKEIYYHKMRSFLTLLGVMLGVASLVIMMSIMEGFRVSFERMMNQMGGMARVSVYNLDQGQRGAKVYKSRGVRIDDMRTLLLENGDIIDIMVPQVTAPNYTIRRGNKSLRVWSYTALGATSDYSRISGHVIDEGRDISPLDDASFSRVCVIGSIVRSELFEEYQNPIGETIFINNIGFHIIGLYRHVSVEPPHMGEKIDTNAQARDERLKNLKTLSVRRAIVPKRGSEELWGRSLWEKYGRNNTMWHMNLNALIPFSTFQQLMKSDGRLDSIEIILRDSKNLPAYIERLRTTLRKKRGGTEDFQIKPWAERYNETNQQIQTMSLVFIIIAVIALIVGGIGIMNVILASISERIREIGVRKSVGAGNLDIFMQFLVETVMLSIFGGMFGVGLGSVLTVIIAHFIGIAGVIAPMSIIVAISSSCGIGLVFGLYPSFKAAKLDPITALRYE
ncbi:MAG: ABC transporter permease [Spirochaetota bacterium]